MQGEETLKPFRKSRKALVAAVALVSASAAQAHMPYVLPTQFDVGKGDHVTAQSSFTEDAFVPDIAMRDAPFHLVKPDGETGEVGPVTYLRDLSIFEADLKTDGTYRISTGQRAGRKATMYRDGDKWVMREEGGAAPANATPVAVQSMTLAEAYVTRGKPSGGALKPTGKALEIQAVTHPNEIASGADASFVVLFDGKPLANADITLFRSAGVYDGRKIAAQVKSDASGRFTLRPGDAGTYLILVRHRAAAPAGSETPWRSYTYTLAFDAA